MTFHDHANCISFQNKTGLTKNIEYLNYLATLLVNVANPCLFWIFFEFYCKFCFELRFWEEIRYTNVHSWFVTFLTRQDVDRILNFNLLVIHIYTMFVLMSFPWRHLFDSCLCLQNVVVCENSTDYSWWFVCFSCIDMLCERKAESTV